LGARVFTIERQEALYKKTKQLLDDLGFSGIRMYFKDGYLGLPEFAPFDKILVTAGAPEVPEKLLKQLKIGGVLVVPVGVKIQRMLRIIRLSEDEFKQEEWGDFRFVPFLSGIQKRGL
jgi:protein-L-isoaspartate(D-aspartate) O-methyltransferase